ncbi:MMPL family transporter [Pengzhenrongella frigida]|uniref:MMPL family transporter n=1 Tax=Pengzhenrongella frigida TaxID=1259133 RepID=A0A4Q5N1U4_9MICO|nr:MMPL family transporter [Cellulomonas sp. HLT2-17]RYV52152.1 MMPL family transporter [Cellulomonas sp. HLT2-17]
MKNLALWCSRRKRTVLGLWVVAFIGLVCLTVGVGASFNDSSDAPAAESTTAYGILAQAGLYAESSTTTGNIVWQVDGLSIDDPSVQADVAAMASEVAAIPGVQAVASPYDATNPAATTQISAATGTAFATVTVEDGVDIDAISAAAHGLDSSTTQTAVGGEAFYVQPGGSHGPEALGIIAAFAILFLMFRSMWASVLPILTGLAGVGVSMLIVVLASNWMNLSATSLTMGALIGLGVGIDYALFIVNRHRKALMAGKSVPEAIAQALDTSGRAVIFAGLTVIVALLGMFVVGLGVLTGMSRAAALTVLFTVAAAVTLLPALLAMIGPKILSKRQRAELVQLTAGTTPASTAVPSTVAGRAVTPGRSTRWALKVQGAPRRMAAGALLLVLVLAAPVLSLNVGDADASADPAGSPTREYFDLMSTGFGAGYDNAVLLVATTPNDAAGAAFTDLVAQLSSVDNVTTVGAAPYVPGQQVAVASITPGSSPQANETTDLITTLRDDVIPAAETGTDLQVSVTGTAAVSMDLAHALMSKLPLYLALIALLGFLLLAMAFRSILVPLVGAVSNIATILVGMGVTTALFQWGWGTELLRVGGGAPIIYIIPILIVGIMFGLSMDYQVFLVSRMHEEWTHTRDNARAVRVGVAETGRVITTAAMIMFCVFASFALTGERIVAMIGMGLAVAVLVDAFVVRLTLVPALMKLIGDRNWAYPRWADRLTPHLSVEGAPEADDDSDPLDAAAHPVGADAGSTRPTTA